MKWCNILRGTVVLIAAAAAASAQSTIANPSLSNLAAGVLDQTRLAREAIATHDRDAAVNHVARAIATVNQIQQNAPNAARPLMVPIGAQMQTTTTTTPVHRNGDLKGDSAIRGVEGETITTRLDVTAAGSSLAAAQAALEAGNWSVADAALAAVQSSEAVTQTTGDMPLRMAQQNLELARARILDGKYHDAERPLKSAAQALGDYESRMSGQQPVNVDSARLAISDYAERVSHEHGDALDRIDNWMSMIRQWQGAQ